MHGANLEEILVLLLAAVIIVAVFKRLQLSPVLGYLVAGGAIGPFGLGIIKDVAATRYIAEFGVVFLLFAIGLELTFERLKSMRMHVFGFGTAQVALSGLLIGLVALWFGVPVEAAILIGGGLALSSTAIVLQVLMEQGEQATQVGRLSLAVLILQDLAVVPLLIMVPLLNDPNAEIGEVILDALGKAIIALIFIFLLGRQFLRPIFHLVGSLRNQELFIATTLMTILGAAWATQEAGLSLALGAFIAGLLVAETEYRPQVEADIQPFKGLLMGLFFMTVGMSIDFRLLEDKLYLVILLTSMLIIGKAVVVILLARAFGFRNGPSIQAGLLLSQGSEFAFVLFGLALGPYNGLLDAEIGQTLFVVIALSMAVTPLLALIGKEVVKRLERKDPIMLEPNQIMSETQDLDGHIIVAGFGRVGNTVCKLLTTEDLTNYIAIDSDPAIVHEARQMNFPVYYGHADRLDILQSIGIERASAVVITVRDKKTIRKTVSAIHRAYPDVPIVTRAFDRRHANQLHELGARVALPEAFESSLLLGKAILSTTGVPENEIERVLNQFREEEYPTAAEIKLSQKK